MEKVLCLYKYYYVEEFAYNIADFPFDMLKKTDTIKGYVSLPATFDIEASTIKDKEKPFGFMYHWQMCVQGIVVFGRTWTEWMQFMQRLSIELDLNEKNKLVVYVHNLSYEFQFIRKFIGDFKVFATDARKILTVKTDTFEFRCSYRLSNMNLSKFIMNSPNTIHWKASEDLDYRVLRTPQSSFTLKEKGYFFNDVKGLYEAILTRLVDDDLKSIPLTSTGYVRRDCRNAMRRNKSNRKLFLKTQLSLDQYILCKEAFRGGDTASNMYLCNTILRDVKSYDISSSYPYVMLTGDYPISAFMRWIPKTRSELNRLNKRYSTIGKYVFKNIKLKNDKYAPYIPIAKCNCYAKPEAYNGRILSADMLSITCTNYDFEIIADEYTFDELFVEEFLFAKKGKLPKELRERILFYFEGKSKLKGIDGKEYEYAKSKEYLNAIFGMMVTDILHNEWLIDEQDQFFEEKSDPEEKLRRYYTSYNSFLPYQWGVFITAQARYRLREGLRKVGFDAVYWDTDSIKFIGNHENVFEELNNKVIENKSGLPYNIEINGKVYSTGIWEREERYDEFKTMGAKKYAFVKNGKIGITVSGLNKKQGAKELTEKGGLSHFKIGEVFFNSNRTCAYYNDEEPHIIEIDGVRILTASNIAIVDETYTLGISDTMLSILELVNSK